MRWITWLIACSLSAGSFEWREQDASRLELTENGQTVFVYNHGPGRQCCYLHPVQSPNGVVVTDDGPADHKHHRGLFWAWPIVEMAGQRSDLWLMKGAEHRFERILERNASESQAGLKAEHSWMVQRKRAVRETISIFVRPSTGQTRKIEFTLTLEAPEAAVRIAGAPESGKGYGGFSARFAPRTNTVIQSSDGPVLADEDHFAHAWAELTGSFPKGRAGLRIASDNHNQGYPNQWCLRPYGFVGASFPGTAFYTLLPGKPVTLRYEVTLFDAPVWGHFFAPGKTRVLILSGRNNHDWRSTTPQLRQILEETARFDVRVIEEPSGLTAQALEPYDVLVSDYNGPRWGASTEQAVEQFVASGKGFVATHAASYAFGDMEILGDKHVKTGLREAAWPAYGEMLGVRWSAGPPRSGHGKRHTFRVRWTDRKHPIAANMEESFAISDELYHNLVLQPPARVIATAFDAPEMNGTGRQEPIAWTTQFGQGRVFYTTLGHDFAAMSAPGFTVMIVNAVAWAAGTRTF